MPSIDEILQKIKPFYTVVLIVLIGGISFGLGRLSVQKQDKTSIKIEYPNTEQVSSVIAFTATTTEISEKSTTVVVPALSQSGEVIGSKSGKKYYFPWCGTVKRILPQNQVHFDSIEDARAAGFTPGGNCKGLK